MCRSNDDFNPEAYASAALEVIQAESPDLVLVGSTSMGMDIAPVLGVSMDLPVISYCSGIENSGDGYEFTSQLYGGKMDVKSSASKAVAMVLAGSFSADEGNRVDLPMLKMCQLEQVPQEFNSRN